MILTLDDLRQNYSFSFPESMDDYYTELLQDAEEVCLKYADLELGSFQEYFNGGGRIYVLTHCPVKTVKEIKVAGEVVSDYRYEKRPHAVVLRDITATGNDNVVVTYESGWDEAPRTLKIAIALTVQHLAKLQSAKLLGITARSTDGGTETIEQSVPPLAVQKLLDGLRTGLVL